MRGCSRLSSTNAISFFYQWAVKTEDWTKLAVNSHRGQEFLKVAPIGFANSVPYVQREIDNILRSIRAFLRAYIDDIVTFSKDLNAHIPHLQSMFGLLQEFNIAVAPDKTNIGFPTIKLLGQYVDSLGLSTHEERVAAIMNLEFPKTLSDLETALGMTGVLRTKIQKYAQVIEPLQRRKTLLLKNFPTSGH